MKIYTIKELKILAINSGSVETGVVINAGGYWTQNKPPIGYDKLRWGCVVKATPRKNPRLSGDLSPDLSFGKWIELKGLEQ